MKFSGELSMVNDLLNLCWIGEFFFWNGLNFVYFKIFEGYVNKYKISGCVNVKGDMYVVGGL